MATFGGTSGNDSLLGTSGNDQFLMGGTGGTDTINGAGGFDSIEFSSRANSAIVADFAAGTISGGSPGTIGFTNIERIVAGNFNDRISGSAAGQTLNGLGGADTLWGAGGIDVLWGGAGADSFLFREVGSGNADSVRDFGSGTDKLVLDGAAMSALGASGNFAAGDARFKANSTGTATDASDRVIYNTATRQVFYDADGNGSGGAQLIATLQSGVTLAATDIVVEGGGSGGGQVINGTAGDDSLVGGAGNDTINGFAGEDTIDGGPGTDSMVGGAHADTYFVDNSGDIIVELEGGGFDTVNASASYVLPEWVNHLTLVGTAAINGFGNDLANVITGNSGHNTLNGDAGDDTIIGGDGDDRIEGDLIDDVHGNDSIDGGAGDDFIRGGNGDDTMIGGAGSDAFGIDSGFLDFEEYGGNDSIDGGDGVDGISFGTEGVSTTHAVIINLTAGTYTIAHPAGQLNGVVINVENVTGSGFDDDITGTDGPNAFGDIGGGATIRGLGGDDFFHAEGGNQRWDGGAGDDTMEGSPGSDTLAGGLGNDVLGGDHGGFPSIADSFLFDVAPGPANADLITDFASARDKIVLDGTAHANSGPSGNFSAGDARFWSSASGTAHDADDRVIYNTSTGELWYDADGNGAGARQLIATLQGTPSLAATDIAIVNGTGGGGQVINGTSGDDSLVGSPENDTINGFAGNDTLVGNGGNDSLDGGADADTLDGGTGDDHYVVTHGDSISDSGGVDTVFYEYDEDIGAWTLGDGLENLVLTGFFETNGGISFPQPTAIGNDLDNVIRNEGIFPSQVARLEGRGGDDTLIGSEGGSDLFAYGAAADYGNDVVDGGETSFGIDRDEISFLDAGSSVVVDIAAGTATGGGAGSVSFIGIEAATGSAFADRLEGDAESNHLRGAVGNDTLVGGAGNDILDDDGIFSGGVAVPNDDDSLSGGAGNDELVGSSGSDWLDGGDGDDSIGILPWNDGSDTIIGGAGVDRLGYSARVNTVIDLAAGTITSGAITSTVSGVENVSFGSSESMATAQIKGTAGANQLSGGLNSDTLDGGAGNDTLIGGIPGVFEFDTDSFVFSAAAGTANADVVEAFKSGIDKLVLDGTVHANSGPSGNFSAGDARFWSSNTGAAHDADDRVIYNTSTGQLWYDADGNGAGARQLIATLQGTPSLAATDIAIVNGSGGGGGQVVNGTSGSDTLTGTSGNDTINGLGGNDLFQAASTGGADVINGGAGFDSIEFASRATSAVVVDFGAGTITGGSSGSIRFTGIERVVAGNFNDSLGGTAGGQTLNGLGGADALWGAGGVDVLWGGAGADTFVFREVGSANADSVRDWASGSDKVALDNSPMSALGTTGNFAAGDARFWSSSTGTAHDANDRVIYNTATGSLYYDADGSGAGAAQLIATFQGAPGVAATDITVI